jgi:splicing factor 3A subunit 2
LVPWIPFIYSEKFNYNRSYEICGFKLQAKEVDRKDGRFWSWFDEDQKEFWVQLLFKTDRDERYSNVPGQAPRS